MQLPSGEKPVRYEILSTIGIMGEVYKVCDTMLDRTVAIQIPPEHITGCEDPRARLERAARAIASRNLPSIGAGTADAAAWRSIPRHGLICGSFLRRLGNIGVMEREEVS